MRDDGPKLRFGLWYDFRNPPQWRQSPDRLYREILDQIVWGENNGFDNVWLSEHHFIEDGYLPSLLPAAAAIAVSTKRIRIASGVLSWTLPPGCGDRGFDHVALPLQYAAHVGLVRARQQPEVGCVVDQVGNLRAPDLVLAREAVDVGTRAADPPSFDDGGPMSRSGHVPGQELSARSATQDENLVPFSRHGHLLDAVVSATETQGSPSRRTARDDVVPTAAAIQAVTSTTARPTRYGSAWC